MSKWWNGEIPKWWNGEIMKWWNESCMMKLLLLFLLVLQQLHNNRYFKIPVLNNSGLAVGRTVEASCSIWDLAEWDEEYGVIQLYWRQLKTGKDDIMLMGGDVRGDWRFFPVSRHATYWQWTAVESYCKALMRVLSGCSHIFIQSNIPVFLSASIKCFKSVLEWWTDLKIVMR